jgi:hypothetical protein
MAGVKSLRKLQFSIESVAGTAVPATTIWAGRGGLKDQRPKEYPDEDVGILGGRDRSYIPRIWAELALESIEATFEQLPYLYELGVAEETPTQDGTGSGYVYAYNAPVTAQNTHATATFEGGDDQQAEEFDYGFIKNINLSGSGQTALMMAADVFGREVTPTTFTGALTVPTVEEIITNTGKLYIDATGGTIGTTQISNTLFGIDLAHNTGLQEYWPVDGSKEFGFTKFTEDEIILRLTYEHNASAVAEKVFYGTNVTRLFRLLFEGSDLATAGTYSKKTLQIDLAGRYDDWSILDEVNGNDIVEATIRCRYSIADALKLEYLLVNELTALP